MALKQGMLKDPIPGTPYELAAGSLTQLSDTPCKIWKISLQGGSAVTTADFHNGSLSTEDRLFSLAAGVSGLSDISFSDIGGLPFNKKMSAICEGTAGIVYVWYEN